MIIVSRYTIALHILTWQAFWVEKDEPREPLTRGDRRSAGREQLLARRCRTTEGPESSEKGIGRRSRPRKPVCRLNKPIGVSFCGDQCN
ncbi:hypothetical protein BCV73_13000 [Paenibacillus sp. SSG-1]|uniref:hypothetical protein n=1 Tax=Paenibacillus sp. SSG-1 TaxID=1443669 RepID=UPI000B7D2D7A|nr:hypothetical protein [Paenibacillus sp. SSG-1]OXL83904.1 hypothetical protein BCV73_13000 [Paenibacillus sp. SSG-1]